MAHYTYECSKCGEQEIEHSIKLDALKVCPKCGSLEFKRLIGKNTGFELKGNGWAKDNYEK